MQTRAFEPCEFALFAIRRLVAGIVPPHRCTPQPRDGLFEACVTLRRAGSVRGCQAARADDWKTAIELAAIRAARDPRYERVSPAELGEIDVEVWLCLGKSQTAHVVPEQLESLEGIEIIDRTGHRRSFFLPGVCAELGLVSDFALLNALYQKAGLAGEKRGVAILRVRWDHFVRPCGQQASVRMRRFAPATLPEHRSSLEAADRALKFLCRTQQADGSFEYIIGPRRRAVSRNEVSNLTRQILCAYALAVAAETSTANLGLIADTLRAFQAYLQKRLLRVGNHQVVRDEDGRKSLGAVAFALLFLARVPDGVLRANLRTRLMRSLTNTLLAAQSTVGWFPSEIDVAGRPGRQDFAPSQAILALACSNYTEHRAAIERAFTHYRELDLRQGSVFLLAWQSKAWLAVWEQSRSARHLEFANRLLDMLATFQQAPCSSNPDPDLAGGFALSRDAVPSNFTTSLFAEALAMGAMAAHSTGNHERFQQLSARATCALDYMHRLQIGPETALLYEREVSVEGGIRLAPSSLNLRCDSTGHALSFFNTAARLIKLRSDYINHSPATVVEVK